MRHETVEGLFVKERCRRWADGVKIKLGSVFLNERRGKELEFGVVGTETADDCGFDAVDCGSQNESSS